MNNVGIVQPGRLGDIIILLPAAKYLHDQGRKVIWPIFSDYVQMFSRVVDYVTFLPVQSNIYTCVAEARSILALNGVEDIRDVAATFPGSNSTEEYVKCGDGLGDEKFDEFKYRLLTVPLDEKWKLQINRNLQKEEELYNLYVRESEYAVVSLNHSKGTVKTTFDSQGKQIIEINTKHSIFDWIKILENAKAIALVESSMSNLVEQLNLSNKKFLFKKPDSRLPVLRNKWTII